jgi:uncharacterized protein YbjT (DUF2867 family)
MASGQQPVLVVGATGELGGAVVNQLRAAGQPVRAIVRRTADPSRRLDLSEAGAELVDADLKDAGSLDAVCAGVGVVVSTATATGSRQPGDTISSVDEQGQLRLVEAAELAGVRHFVFVSFPPTVPEHPLERAKRAVEERLHCSSMSWTILRPLNFIETWLSSAFGFDPAHGYARVLGDGNQPISWVSRHDVARFATAATCKDELRRRALLLGGPDALSYQQVLQIFGELGAPPMTVEHVAEGVLETRVATASTPLQQTCAALMLATARGQVADPASALELLPGRLGTVREYAQRSLEQSSHYTGRNHRHEQS